MKKKKKPLHPFMPDWKIILSILGFLLILVLVFSGKATPKKINIFGLELEFNALTATPVPVLNTGILSIEKQFPIKVFSYDGSEKSVGGFAELTPTDMNGSPIYIFHYSIPNSGIGYAGVAFRFSGGQDISYYKEIEFSLQFSKNDEPIDVYLADTKGNKKSFRIISTDANVVKKSFLLSNFTGVDLSTLKEVTLNAEEIFVRGDHKIIIHEI
jgi:hypothetical protein